MVSGSADGQPMPTNVKPSKRICKGDETTRRWRDGSSGKRSNHDRRRSQDHGYESRGITKGMKQIGLRTAGDTLKSCFAAPGAGSPGLSSQPGERRTLSVWKREIAATQPAQSTVVKERVNGAFKYPGEQFLKITGRVKVIDAHTIVFDDGTEVELNGEADAPDLEQKAMFGDAFYPCGQEAAEFLRQLIGDQAVTCFVGSHDGNKPRGRGYCFVQEKNLQTEMVRNGWALSHHSATEAWEVIARENKRGIWRGKFVAPERWRKGERLPGE